MVSSHAVLLLICPKGWGLCRFAFLVRGVWDGLESYSFRSSFIGGISCVT